jgi:uncharacterized protein YdeI (YjbR/CyaY-like superfamily)
VDQALCFG